MQQSRPSIGRIVGVPQDERSAAERGGGTWHWPERVEG